MQIDFEKEIAHHLAETKKLQKPTGAFTAGPHDVTTGYDKAWLRDMYFTALCFMEAGDIETVQKAARVLVEVFVKHTDKINWAIENRPHETWQYIHARFHPDTFEEYWEEWGNRQHDAVGEVLHVILDLELQNASVLESSEDREMVQKIIDYLCTVEYWHDPDNGIWEENCEVHASSLGSVVTALKKATQFDWLTVPDWAIENGEDMLRQLLPRESDLKFVDLALLSLIYPFHTTTEEETQLILRNVEYHLMRDRGVIRYKLDRYYNYNPDGYSEEAEWCFGLSWLAIIYAERGDKEKAMHYLLKAKAAVTEAGHVPELYYSHTDRPNENTPLGWAQSMYVIALLKVRDIDTYTV